jgi:hypothetical protein
MVEDKGMRLNKFYYLFKPFIPWRIRMAMRRLRARHRQTTYADVWPIDQRAGAVPNGWPGWPEGKRFGLIWLINFEQRAGVQRNAAWQSFAVRANFESARSFVAMLIQTDRFGTPIAKSLGVFSDALRTQRRQKAEERAAKTTIKLVPPLVFCIFPAMGVVLVGPALVSISYFFAHFLHK